MPGQRKRKRSRERARQRTEDTPGRWEPLFSTQDQAELREHLHRLVTDGTAKDPSQLRIDTYCGRLAHPSTYRISIFVPDTST
ncbi:hypothetical protein [Streptomyces sp. NBC_00096]|uniref:hypothetical protein n=1 Tax=Streptomyces sp. NBC_00096 TaxID=2975650 RepID=UPI003256026F